MFINETLFYVANLSAKNTKTNFQPQVIRHEFNVYFNWTANLY